MADSNIALLISLISIVIIVGMFLHYSKNFAKQKEQSTDILYISGYAVLLIIGLVVAICINSFDCKSIMDYITFGSTLSSLIMSVVAIIYTITQGKDGREQLGKITQATEELKETAKTLTEFNAIATVINDAITDLEDNIRIIKSKSDSIDQKIDKISTQNSERNVSIPSNNTYDDTTENNVFNEFLKCGSYSGTLSLLACCYCKEKGNEEISLEQLSQKIDTCDSSYIYGYLIASAALGIVEVSMKNGNLKVSYVHNSVKPMCEDFVKSFLNDNEEFKDEYLYSYNSVRNYFGLPSINIDDLTK